MGNDVLKISISRIDALKKARKRLSLTQQDVARLLDVNQSIISRIETGEIEISDRIREGIEKVYGIDLPDDNHVFVQEEPDLQEIKRLVDTFPSYIPSSSLRAIRTYIEHIITLSTGSNHINDSLPLTRSGLWGNDWSWGPRELERFITPECARTLKWNRLSIHRTTSVFSGGTEVTKTEIYVDARGTDGSTFSAFLDQIQNGGVYTEDSLRKALRDPMNGSNPRNFLEYFKNVIVVRIRLPGNIVKAVDVLMSGDDPYDIYDYYWVESVVRQFLQQRGELNYDRISSLGYSNSPR